MTAFKHTQEQTLIFWSWRGNFQAWEHHPNHEVRGWQYHVGTGALHKKGGIMGKEDYIETLKQYLKTSTTLSAPQIIYKVG